METFNDFVRECYLQSEPSVDINEVTEDNPIDCCKHKLRRGIYEKLMDKLTEALRGKHKPSVPRSACNMWCLSSGPQLVEQ